MPIFEFECPKCKATVEHIVTKEQRTRKCTECGAAAKRRFPSSGSFQLMGGGWGASGYTKVHSGDIAEFKAKYGAPKGRASETQGS